MWSGFLVLTAAHIVRSLPETVPEKHDSLVPRLSNGVGKAPALGWNSWVPKHSFVYLVLK